jgi:hypothetical protein
VRDHAQNPDQDQIGGAERVLAGDERLEPRAIALVVRSVLAVGIDEDATSVRSVPVHQLEEGSGGVEIDPGAEPLAAERREMDALAPSALRAMRERLTQSVFDDGRERSTGSSSGLLRLEDQIIVHPYGGAPHPASISLSSRPRRC